MLNRFTVFMAMIALVLSTLVTPNLAYADGNSVLAGKWMSATEAEMDEARGGALPIIVVIVSGARVTYITCSRTIGVSTCLRNAGRSGWKVVKTFAEFVSLTSGIITVKGWICSTYRKLC